MGDLGLIPGLGRSPGEGKGYPLPYSGLENSMDCIVHGVAKCRTRLSNFHFHFPWWLNGEESTCQCKRLGFNPWVRKILRRRKWQPTLVFWPGEFHGLYSPWGCKVLDTTERLFHFHSRLNGLGKTGGGRSRRTQSKFRSEREAVEWEWER